MIPKAQTSPVPQMVGRAYPNLIYQIVKWYSQMIILWGIRAEKDQWLAVISEEKAEIKGNS